MNGERLKKAAVITGASSGLGREFAVQLSKMGYFTVLVGRNERALEELSKKLGPKRCAVITADLADTKSAIDVYLKARKYRPDILINNAGFGLYGEFTETSLSAELSMIDVNIKAMHILFKLFLKDLVRRDSGYILNVASSAGMMPGPLMTTYYSSKSYVIRQTQGVNTELRRRGSRVRVSVLCPGPVDTDFNRRAGITGFFKGISAEECVSYALKQMKKNRLTIIPTLKMKLLCTAARLVPAPAASYGAYLVQKGKKRTEE